MLASLFVIFICFLARGFGRLGAKGLCSYIDYKKRTEDYDE